MRTVRYSRRAEKDLLALPKPDRVVIVVGIDVFAAGARNIDLKKLRGFDPALYRIRIGRFRVIFAVGDDGGAVVLRISDRKNTY